MLPVLYRPIKPTHSETFFRYVTNGGGVANLHPISHCNKIAYARISTLRGAAIRPISADDRLRRLEDCRLGGLKTAALGGLRRAGGLKIERRSAAAAKRDAAKRDGGCSSGGGGAYCVHIPTQCGGINNITHRPVRDTNPVSTPHFRVGLRAFLQWCHHRTNSTSHFTENRRCRL